MADLIGEVDPIKVAGGLFLDDRSALLRLVPKSIAVSSPSMSCPTSPNGSKSDCSTCWRSATCRSVATSCAWSLTSWWSPANPEDYTNRGRLITPLKDRFGSQIRTHYPYEFDDGDRHHAPRAKLAMAPVPITVPWFIDDIVARVSHVARRVT